MAFNTVVAQFFTKERLKKKRLLRRHHQIEDMSFLNVTYEEPTFSCIDKDEKKEEEEVEQEELQRESPLA